MNNIIDKNIFVKNIIMLIFLVIFIHVLFNFIFQNESFEYENETVPKKHVYYFWASWCSHCVTFKENFNKFKEYIKDDKDIQVHQINCDDTNDANLQNMLDKYKILGFPSVVVEDENGFSLLQGNKTTQEIIDIVYNDFERFTNTGFITVLNFNTSWCKHSQNFQQTWNNFSEAVKSYNIKAIDVKCDDKANIKLCEKFNINSYPTILILKEGEEIIKYSGPRTVEGLFDAVVNIPDNANENESDTINEMHANPHDNTDKTIVYNFYTKWCGYSQRFMPIWNTFANSLKESDNVKAIDIDCELDENKDLVNKYKVEGFPTVIIVKNKLYELYSGPRTVEDLREKLNI